MLQNFLKLKTIKPMAPFLIGIGTIILIAILKARKKTVIPPTSETTDFFPIVPTQIIRNDALGLGHFGASRGLRTHKGIDIIAQKGETIFSPIDGFMERFARPYADDDRWNGLLIKGMGSFEKWSVKMFYLTPSIAPGQVVVRGVVIGEAQAISEKFNPDMIDHIHVEVYYDDVAVDPAPLFGLMVA